MSAIEVLKKEKELYLEKIKDINKANETRPEDIAEMYKKSIKTYEEFISALDKALLALEQKDKLSKWLDDVEGFETKEFRDTLEKSLFGKLVGTCKVREIMNLKKERVGEQK